MTCTEYGSDSGGGDAVSGDDDKGVMLDFF